MNYFRSNTPTLAVPLRPREHPRHREPFVHFIPLGWLACASKAPGSNFCLHVAVLLHYAAGVTRRQTVTLSSKLLAEFGVDRHSSYRALQALEVAALVRVQRRKGKKPLVTIVPLDPSTAEALDHVGE